MPGKAETGEKPFNQPQGNVAISRRLRTVFTPVSSNGEISRSRPLFGLSVEFQTAERRSKRLIRWVRYDKTLQCGADR